MNENKIIGTQKKQFVSFSANVVKIFNLLCTGSYYKPRNVKVCNLFINSSIKRLQTFEMLEQNKARAHQLYFLLCKVAGAVTRFGRIIENDEGAKRIEKTRFNTGHFKTQKSKLKIEKAGVMF